MGFPTYRDDSGCHYDYPKFTNGELWELYDSCERDLSYFSATDPGYRGAMVCMKELEAEWERRNS